jgi:hypothetical protein
VIFMEQAVSLIPFTTINALREWLRDHKHELPPALYRKHGVRMHRWLTLSEMLLIRTKIFRLRGAGRQNTLIDPALISWLREAMHDAPAEPAEQEGR